MTLEAVAPVLIGCETFIIVCSGGSVIHFIQGALRGSSKGGRLAGGVQEVVANAPRIRGWASWFGVMATIKAGMVRVCHVRGPLSIAAAWAGANALFSVRRGARAALCEGIKGAVYSQVAGLAAGCLLLLFKSWKGSSK